MANKWFETVAVAQRRARKRLPASVYGALVAGSESGFTIDDNIRAFSELGFAPPVLRLSGKREQATTVMGQEVSPGAHQLEDCAGLRARRSEASSVAAQVPPQWAPSRSERAQHGRTRPTATNVLRCLQPVDAESDTDVGRHFLAARRMGWAVHAQRSHADR
jgi:hypothetical protein